MARIDFNKLEIQYPKNYQKISFEVPMPLYDYHPWNNGENPRIDKVTNTLLNLKSKDEKKIKQHQAAISYFSKVITTQLLRLKCNSPKLFCIVPSHEVNCLSSGLLGIMHNIRGRFGFENTTNILNRSITVPKAATGGDRSVQHHLDSIVVNESIYIRGKIVYLFDDISSTGNSLIACKKILLDAGAKSVVMIPLAQTWG
jgi:predicted amidophosphoribosyltransferase